MIIRSGIPYGDEVRFRVLLSGALRAYTLPQISAKEREDWEKVPKEDREIAKSPRGLLFVCYQSSIDNGFYRQTTGFANNDYFPITSLAPDKIGLYNSLPPRTGVADKCFRTGQDPIIGGPQPETQASGQTEIEKEGLVTLKVINTSGKKFTVSGIAKKDQTSLNPIPEKFFVTSRGGEYYFVPSIQTVKDWAEGK